ncbi:hypothetical protein HMPREF0104_04148 [Bacteroides sp. 3_1_19]|nr:hypothetical protein HMPREF0104_04148 [Bacteroides sp. 3_1_19]
MIILRVYRHVVLSKDLSIVIYHDTGTDKATASRVINCTAKQRTLVQTLAVERVVRAGEEACACLVVNQERQGEIAESIHSRIQYIIKRIIVTKLDFCLWI